MKRLFEIQTLSECQPRLSSYQRLSDPLLVITGIATILPSIFPGLTGSERLTMDHLNKLFPGNGFYTTQYKNWLLQRVKYVKDLERDLHMYTGKFIEANMSAFCNGGTGQQCWQGFYKVLQTENITGGNQPVGNVFGGGFDFQTLLLIGGGVLLLALLTKKKSRKK